MHLLECPKGMFQVQLASGSGAEQQNECCVGCSLVGGWSFAN